MTDDPQFAAFARALDNITKSIDGLDGHVARLALTISLAESIVFGEDDNIDDELRLPFVLRTLGDIVADMMLGPGDDDWDDDDPFDRVDS